MAYTVKEYKLEKKTAVYDKSTKTYSKREQYGYTIRMAKDGKTMSIRVGTSRVIAQKGKDNYIEMLDFDDVAWMKKNRRLGDFEQELKMVKDKTGYKATKTYLEKRYNLQKANWDAFVKKCTERTIGK